MDAPDDRTFRIILKRPMGVVLDALAHPAPIPLFIMPERLAVTDPFKQVTEMVGSGPYKFVANEFVSGSRVAYQRNEAYVPRDEAPEWTSGGMVRQPRGGTARGCVDVGDRSGGAPGGVRRGAADGNG
jgi:peptide/nickel transport system substrate-binding protein